MERRRVSPRIVHRAGLGVAAGALLAGMTAAQPTAPVAPAPVQAPTAPPVDPEEAPPLKIAPPAPSVAPPVKAEEVAPAAPPKEQVADKPVEEPKRRPRYDVAVLQALDKITAETLRFEAAVGKPVRWKGLIFTVRACERSAPDEAIDDSIVYVTIEAQPRPQPGRPTPPAREAFKGWMFASSPGLHPLEHPNYDAWAISCRASAPEPKVAASTAARPPAAKPPEPAEPKLLDLPPAPEPTAEPEPKAAAPKAAPSPPEPAPEPAPPAT